MTTNKSITKGIAIEQLVIHHNYSFEVPIHTVTSPTDEYKYYQSVINKLKNRITDKISTLPNESESKDILAAHITMLNDPLINEDVASLITHDHLNAVHAYKTVLNKYINIFKTLENEYIKSRIADLDDLFNQFVMVHTGQTFKKEIDKEFILYADKLLPSELLQYNTSLLKGVILAQESLTAHIVILIKELNIPFMINTGKLALEEKIIILDTHDNIIVTNINDEILSQYKSKKQVYINTKNLLNNYIDKKSSTKDNHNIDILSNISSIDDAQKAKKLNSDGIGLFRTEYLYIGQKEAPSLDKQIDTYKKILKIMNGKKVVIRTFDFGSDKDVSFLDKKDEQNPNLGMRGIRLGLVEKELLKTQLKALLSVQEEGNLYIMIPLISHLSEILDVKELLNTIELELNITKQYKFGIMIETPSSALNASLLATHVDFFSIGTNDLYQYTYAIDRLNEALESYYQPLDPTFLHLIKQIITAADAAGIEVSMCGELAGDLTAAPILYGLGLKSFSMSNASILQIKELFSNLSHESMVELSNRCLALDNEKDVIKEVHKTV